MTQVLTAKKLRDLLHYDPETGQFRHKRATGRGRVGAVAGTRSGPGYWGINVLGKKYFAHRLAWLYMTGEWPSGLIDHIDRDKLNNSWGNLRQVTQAENQMNKSPRKNGLSRYVGVTFCNRRRKWKAQIGLDRKTYNLGYFETEEAAAMAYQAAKPKMHRIGAW